MTAPVEFAPDFGPLRRLVLDMAQQRSVNDVLKLTVEGLAERPNVALARIWLTAPGDICDGCPMRNECPDQSACLHLVASAGRSRVDPGADWSRIDGDFRRVPLGVHKVGEIGATGELSVVPDLQADLSWLVHPDWARREDILAFGGQPLIYKEQILGAVAVFLRIKMDREEGTVEEGLAWLRIIADHVATAIANARFFEEIERLRHRLQMENAYLREEVLESHGFGDIVGRSPALRAVIDQIDLVAPTEASVLILGESGTGKELVAREIHRRSQRSKQAMIRVNCASIPRELYESEFFGHVRGAFTGAVKDRAGRFELADGGTLFLDEVGEIPLELQSKLLRVLQDGQYERVGDERTRQTDVRIIAATNRNLKQEVEAGRFREDLYYRINVFPIEVTPLRRRRDDIAPLGAHFLELASRKFQHRCPRLTQAHIAQLMSYDWPGNARELQNIIERAVITSRSGVFRFDLPQEASTADVGLHHGRPTAGDDTPEVVPDGEMRRRERENIRAALHQAGWKISGPGGAAELLGMKPTTLASRIKRLGLEKPG